MDPSRLISVSYMGIARAVGGDAERLIDLAAPRSRRCLPVTPAATGERP